MGVAVPPVSNTVNPISLNLKISMVIYSDTMMMTMTMTMNDSK